MRAPHRTERRVAECGRQVRRAGEQYQRASLGGLIDELGKQVLNIACRAAVDWDVVLSVNISPVQFKNPQFVETLMDDGYAPMYPIMRALREVGFDGVVIADHVPRMVGGGRAGAAYSVGYMRALIERANGEARS